MNFRPILLPALACLTISGCDLEKLLGSSSSGGGLSTPEIIQGLKTALKVGIDSSASRLGRKDGYLLNNLIKIALPEDVSRALAQGEKIDALIENANPVVRLVTAEVIRSAGFDFNSFAQMKDKLITGLNRAAEMAAPKSVDIFVSAITDMAISDGAAILKGDSTAATAYLREKTFTPLSVLYRPFVEWALDQVKANELWEQFAGSYNQLIGMQNSLLTVDQVGADGFISNLENIELDSLTTDLSDYTTSRALGGLFHVIGQEETRIRRDPLARVAEILKKVFGSLDN